MFPLAPRREERLFGDIDRLFEAFWRPFFSVSGVYRPEVTTDVVETDDSYIVECDLPGLNKKDITVEVAEPGVVTVRTELKEEVTRKDASYVRRERRYQNLCRTFHLGPNADVSSARAKYENGVLKVEVPKVRPEKKGRILEIE